MTDDLYIVIACRNNGGSRLLNVSSFSFNLNPSDHKRFRSDSVFHVAQNRSKMSCVRFDLDVALPVLIVADRSDATRQVCRSQTVGLPLRVV